MVRPPEPASEWEPEREPASAPSWSVWPELVSPSLVGPERAPEPALPKLERASGSAQPLLGARERRRPRDAAPGSGSQRAQKARGRSWRWARPEQPSRAQAFGPARVPEPDRPQAWADRCSGRGSGLSPGQAAPEATSARSVRRRSRQRAGGRYQGARLSCLRPSPLGSGTARPVRQAAGSSTQKVAPSPGVESTPIVPRCSSTSRLAMARPIPCPSTVERSRPRRLNGSNS